ncbi:hypothetical protein [Anaerolactibacter massiliensis]|uniref:hypothetical protein n=1 Tax=Anaerolactibacter massiliensis TaxID=2044573 RepID=UPI00107EECF8|nr:hypothetical protein [Anaerolactibacter massiliensis]
MREALKERGLPEDDESLRKLSVEEAYGLLDNDVIDELAEQRKEEKSIERQKRQRYEEAMNDLSKGMFAGVEKALKAFKELGDYENSVTLAETAEANLAELKEKEKIPFCTVLVKNL